MGISELSRRTGLVPSDVHRILNSLQPCGFIDRNLKTHTYRLGAALVKLGLTALQHSNLCEHGRPLLQRMSERLQATAHMAAFDRHGLDIFIAEQIDYPGETPFRSTLGSTPDPACTALGKAILANIDRTTAFALVQRTSGSLVADEAQLARLELELSRISRRGYALDLEETARNACCIGAPVRDFSGTAIAAVSISMTVRHFYSYRETELAASVKLVAAELSGLLGYEDLARRSSALC
jgi:DNA-binding IclR family transcriptional regulator